MGNSKTVIRISDAFAENLRDLMREKGLSNADLAEQVTAFSPKDVPLSESAVSDYLNPNKTRLPKVELLVKLADFFEVSIEHLVGKTRTRTADLTAKEIESKTGIDADVLERWNKRLSDYKSLCLVLSYLMDELCNDVEFAESIDKENPELLSALAEIGDYLFFSLQGKEGRRYGVFDYDEVIEADNNYVEEPGILSDGYFKLRDENMPYKEGSILTVENAFIEEYYFHSISDALRKAKKGFAEYYDKMVEG